MFDSRSPHGIEKLAHCIRGSSCFLLILVFASGCTTWRPHSLETAIPDTGPLHGHFRATMRDGSSVNVKDVLISGDSISGLRDSQNATPTEWPASERVAVPRSQVIAFRRLSFSVMRTIGSLAGAFAVFVALGMVAMSQSGD